jgi:hypothetical protein
MYSGTSGKIIAKSVEQSLFREAVIATASQQIVRTLWNLSSSPPLQKPATCPSPELDKSNKRSHPICCTSLLPLPFYLCLGLASGLSASVLPQKLCVLW